MVPEPASATESSPWSMRASASGAEACGPARPALRHARRPRACVGPDAVRACGRPPGRSPAMRACGLVRRYRAWGRCWTRPRPRAPADAAPRYPRAISSPPRPAPEPEVPRARASAGVILDMDLGIDDAVALLYLASRPNVTIAAAGSVHGNTPADLAAGNLRRVLGLAGRPEVPVARRSAMAPLAREAHFAPRCTATTAWATRLPRTTRRRRARTCPDPHPSRSSGWPAPERPAATTSSPPEPREPRGGTRPRARAPALPECRDHGRLGLVRREHLRCRGGQHLA